AGSPTTDAATAATWFTDRTFTSKLAGEGFEELRLPSDSRPGRLLASFRACSALTYFTEAMRGSEARRACRELTASSVASEARYTRTTAAWEASYAATLATARPTIASTPISTSSIAIEPRPGAVSRRSRRQLRRPPRTTSRKLFPTRATTRRHHGSVVRALPR